MSNILQHQASRKTTRWNRNRRNLPPLGVDYRVGYAVPLEVLLPLVLGRLPVRVLNLSPNTTAVMSRAGINTVGDVVNCTRPDLIRAGLYAAAVDEIEASLDARGLHLLAEAWR